MHPEKDELRAFLDQELVDSGRAEEVKAHIEACEFCSEFCADYRSLTEPLEHHEIDELPDKLRQLAGRLYDDALRNSVIDLKPLIRGGGERSATYLAADGVSDERQGVRNLATLCSENPEVVLRVMRDPKRTGDYLQLLAEDDRLAAHVMVRLPDLNREFITDAEGRADLDLTDLTEVGDLEQLKWQIKMPEAVFELEPLTYDPDRTEYAEEVTLETDRHDLIEIRFEGKTEGHQLSVRVVELDGRQDFGPITVVVSQQESSQVRPVEPGRSAKFGPINSDTTINIRLYQ